MLYLLDKIVSDMGFTESGGSSSHRREWSVSGEGGKGFGVELS